MATTSKTTLEKSIKKKEETPLMKQFWAIKAKHPDALLLFRVGDFYETFGTDAIKTSRILGIVLTARNNGGAKLELAGFPYHSLDTYLPKLVRAGERVAICDQLEDPKTTKKIVKRGVTELVTPGVALNDNILNQKSSNYLAVLNFGKKEVGVSFVDISTGEFMVAEGTTDYIGKLLQSFLPSEVLFARNKKNDFHSFFGDNYHTYYLDEWVFTEEFTYELLLKHFGTNSLKGFGIEEKKLATIAAGGALHYLADTHHNELKHITNISRIERNNHVWLDKFTIRNLELFHPNSDNGVSLIDVIDQTNTPMGARMLKKWLALPLLEKKAIESRHETVAYFSENSEISSSLESHIKTIGDLERLISRASVGKINPREVLQLNRALLAIKPIITICKSASKSLQKISSYLNICEFIQQKIEREINDECPVLLSKGSVINAGVSKELDDLRGISFSGKDYLAKIQQREIERTGIPKLKIGFNNVFGYYLEVSNAHKDKVPEEWHRKQTLTNAERYITEELKEYESKILGAEDKIAVLEATLYNDLVLSLADFINPIQQNALAIAQLDCLLSFSTLAIQNGYTKPEMSNGKVLEITEGRHPVIETQLPLGNSYIANDVYLDNDTQQIIMITGPNMSGKSALLRQTALIVLLAQIGSFVPAKHAKISLTDKIFTRVGASDNISLGESTFMVEMNETSSILNNLSERSLILLDEIGRGTSTYDGISIAWAIAEYIHEHKTRAKTLFATHYHELNDMSDSFKRIKNFNVSVKELKNKIIFMRKLVKGGSEHSFGIHVAKMAGMPLKVLNRAEKMLAKLEEVQGSNESKSKKINLNNKSTESDYQLSFFQLDDPTLSQIKEEIENIDIDTLTPIEALMKLNEIKKITGA